MDVFASGSNISARNWNDELLSALSVSVQAFDGNVGTGAIQLPDTAGVDEFSAGRPLVVSENFTLLSSGFLADQGRVRGTTPSKPSRESTYAIEDANARLQEFNVVDWVRPSETLAARWAAFASAYLPDLDTTNVLPSTVTLPPRTYLTDQGAGELIADTVEYAGDTVFVHDLATGSNRRHLHVHPLTSGHAATITITDDPTVVDGVTFFAPQNPQRDRSVPNLVTTVTSSGSSGTERITVSDPAKQADHDVAGRHHEALVEFPDALGSVELLALAQRYLTEHKEETDTFSCTIGPLDETALRKFRAGDLITVTSQVWGLTAATKRIANVKYNLTPAVNGRNRSDLWNAELELNMPIRLGKPAAGLADPTALTAPCVPGEGTPLNAQIEAQIHYLKPGIKINDLGTSGNSGFQTSLTDPYRVGYDWNKVLEVIGFVCPGGLEYHDPQEYHSVLRFDTRSQSSNTDCITGARLKLAVPGPDCACGPYEIAHGAYFAGGSNSRMTTDRFGQGTTIGVIDLATIYGCDSPLEYDIPRAAINFGGYTDLVIRPKWKVDAAMACSATLPSGDSSGAIHCSNEDTPTANGTMTPLQHLIGSPWHWLQPENVHQARIGCTDGLNPKATLSLLSMIQSNCTNEWTDAVCALTTDDPAVPSDNCDDLCCAHWWKIPCGHYQTDTLEVSVGGRILKRNLEYREHKSRKVFYVISPTCTPPQVRFVMSG